MEAASRITTWGSFIKFSHTVFALPFAMSMFVVAKKFSPLGAADVGRQLACILIALVSARSAAMTFNRILDRKIDALNPRTSERELPAGRLSLAEAWRGLILFCAIFFAASAGCGIHCLVLAPAVLFVLLFYSWTKRFTSWAHLVLGTALALAPGGVWYALTARFAILPLWMMAGVALWVAGFDILYSCQDLDFDRRQNLFSIPAKLGISGALRVARIFHFVAALALLAFGVQAELGVVYYGGLAIFAAFLYRQHRLVGAGDLSRINAAFFTSNGMASLVYLGAVLFDAALGNWRG